MFIALFLQLWTTREKFKKKKKKKVTFSDFYCLIINTKFWITNKKMYIQMSLLVMFIASFLQLWTTNKTKTFKNQKSKKSHLLNQCKILEYK